MTHKLCPKCNQVKALELFSISRQRRDGRNLWCRECSNANSKRNRDKWKTLPKETVSYKTCPGCGEVKPVDCFGRDISKKDGLTRCCKECVHIHDQEMRIRHRDKIRARRRAYYESHADAINAKAKQWQEKNPGLFSYYCRKSSAKQRKIPWHIDQEWYLVHIWEKRCAYGNHPCEGGIDRADNSRGYEPDNCVPCCWWCNTIKGTHTITEVRSRIAEILESPPPEPPNQLGFDWV